MAGHSGRWVGPRYEERGNPGNAGLSSLAWNVSFDQRQGEAEGVASANRVHHDWQLDQRGGLSVPHVVGNVHVGTVLGYFFLMSREAQYEGVLAFPLDRNLHAVIRFEALEPASDAFLVKGSIIGSTWNRGQQLLALSGVRLQGNLPPRIVSVRAADRGRIVRGRVVDRFLNAVFGARVSLERLAGGSWRQGARSRTNPRGFYSFRVRKRGTYRVTVRMAGFTATSRELRAGR